MNLHIQETKSKCEFQPYEYFKSQIGQCICKHSQHILPKCWCWNKVWIVLFYEVKNSFQKKGSIALVTPS